MAGPGLMCLMCLEPQWRGVRMSAVSAPCQTCPRQKLDAKFKQGSKLNFNKPLTSFLLPLPETHNAWLDRQGETVSSYKMLQLENISRIMECSCFRMISSELDAWPRAIVKLIWLSDVTNKKATNTNMWTRRGAVVGMSCSHVSLSWGGCCLKTVMTSWRDVRHPEPSTMTRRTLWLCKCINIL